MTVSVPNSFLKIATIKNYNNQLYIMQKFLFIIIWDYLSHRKSGGFDNWRGIWTFFRSFIILSLVRWASVISTEFFDRLGDKYIIKRKPALQFICFNKWTIHSRLTFTVSKSHLLNFSDNFVIPKFSNLKPLSQNWGGWMAWDNIWKIEVLLTPTLAEGRFYECKMFIPVFKTFTAFELFRVAVKI